MDWLHTGVALQGGVARDAFAMLGGHELAVGDRLGPFAISGELGRGGMAIVYAADRADGEFEQQVAIKWMPGGAHGETAALLFRRERQILAALRHPHIARLLDGGRTADGMLWFAMERVEGLRLDLHLADGRAGTLTERLRLLRQVCAALAFAHGRGLVHRDIKPANIAVDADGSVKLLDFGVALLAEHDPDSLRQAYTPGWASPEQLRGEPTGPASDIYQLGLLLRWLRDAAPATAEPVPRALRRELAAIVAHALADRPEQRYASVAELERDLDAWRQQRPLVAQRGNRRYRVALFLRRHALASAVAVAALLGVGALIAAVSWRLAAERDHAVAEAERADAAREFLVSLFRGADPTARKGLDLSARELLDRGEARIGTELVGQPALRADLQESLASVYHYLAEHGRAEKLVRASLAADNPSDPRQRLDRARRLLLLANIHARAARPAEALTQTGAVLAALTDAAGPQALELELGALNLRAMAFKQLGRADEAADTLQRLLARVDASPKAQEHRAYAADNPAHVREVQGRWSDARVQAGECERPFGPSHAECALTWQLWDEPQLRRGDSVTALHVLREAVALREGSAHTGHRSLALAQLPLALALCRHDRADEGRRVLAQARDNLRVTPPSPLDSDLLDVSEAACRE